MAQHLDVPSLRTFLSDVFAAMGVERALTTATANAYLLANLYGLASHGVMRIPRIVDGIDAGTHMPSNRAEVVRDDQATALLNGNHALGVPVALTALRLAMDKAAAYGVGAVGVFDSNHFGMAGYYPRLAAEQGYISFAFCNGSPGVAAAGGRRAVLGTNPVAIGVPRRGGSIVLDMSIASIVRGKVLELQRRGELLPDGVAVDSEGRTTTDPTEALAGALLPYGGSQSYKTFGLAFMIDVLSGPLVGAMFGDKVTGSANTQEWCTKGDFYIVVDPRRFRDFEDYLDDIEELAATVKESGPNVYLAGEIELQRAAAAGDVLELDDDMARQILALGPRFSVEPPGGLLVDSA